MKKSMLVLIVSFIASYGHPMHRLSFDIAYSQATKYDLSQIDQFIEKYGKKESDKIVVLPKSIRQYALQSTIENNRLFIAKNMRSEVYGMKKMFVVPSLQEKKEICEQELRCVGPQRKLKYTGFVSREGIMVPMESPSLDEPRCSKRLLKDKSLLIYTGGDLTHPDLRNKRINAQLTDTAFDILHSQVAAYLDHYRNTLSIALLFGLTSENAGEKNVSHDRTPSIARGFFRFLEKFLKGDAPRHFRHYRYEAYMPQFNEDGKMLPDTQSIPGYGCVLLATLHEPKLETMHIEDEI